MPSKTSSKASRLPTIKRQARSRCRSISSNSAALHTFEATERYAVLPGDIAQFPQTRDSFLDRPFAVGKVATAEFFFYGEGMDVAEELAPLLDVEHDLKGKARDIERCRRCSNVAAQNAVKEFHSPSRAGKGNDSAELRPALRLR